MSFNQHFLEVVHTSGADRLSYVVPITGLSVDDRSQRDLCLVSNTATLQACWGSGYPLMKLSIH